MALKTCMSHCKDMAVLSMICQQHGGLRADWAHIQPDSMSWQFAIRSTKWAYVQQMQVMPKMKLGRALSVKQACCQ